MTITIAPKQIIISLALISSLAGAVLLWAGGGVPGAIPSQEITQATYVYEKNESGGAPPGVQSALGELNQVGKVSAAVIENDIVDSTGKTPPRYAIAVKAAREAGLPALVIQAGSAVVRVVKAPTTEQEVQEALQ